MFSRYVDGANVDGANVDGANVDGATLVAPAMARLKSCRLQVAPCGVFVIVALATTLLAATPAPVSPGKPQDAVAQFAAAWAKVNTYTCTLTAHEVSGSRVQDRVYAFYFQKPTDTRINIVGGDGRGSAAVWHGGDTVTGHQGGFLSMIKLTVNIHSHLATSMRGRTVAQANWGAIYDHVSGLGTASVTDANEGTRTITVAVADPSNNDGVTKEVVVLGKDDLPVEYDQYEGDQQVNHVTYSDVKLNVDIPPSTWSI